MTKRILEFFGDRLKEIPTTIIGVIIIALALYGFIALGQGIGTTVEYLIIGTGFILTPRGARDILFRRMDKFKEDTNSD